MNNLDFSTIDEIIAKSLCGKISLEESEQLEIWLSQDEKNRIQYAAYTDLFVQLQMQMAEKLYDTTELYNRLTKEIGKIDGSSTKLEKGHSKRRYYLRYTSIAAACCLIIAGIVWKVQWDKKHSFEEFSKAISYIKPGNATAYLSSSNSLDTISLSEDGYNFAEKLSANNKEADKLSAKIVSAKKNKGVDEIAENCVTVKRGGEYNITLPDGSHVWLNSDSKLFFPERFVGDTRSVRLSGEGYFEVVHNPEKPFIVIANGVETKVLGTEFNVKNYDGICTTTLVNGVVSIKTDFGETTLRPNQEAICDTKAKRLVVGEANVNSATSWRYGLFYFDDEPLCEIFDKISKWYNVDIKFEDDKAPKMKFYGIVKRSRELPFLLDMIRNTCSLKFSLENDTITISNK